MTLRPYQTTAIESTLQALTTHGSAVMQMPTGAGKTKVATEVVKRHNKPVWFICHRQEIERQASAAFTAAGIDHGIVSPRAKPDYGKPVQIVSVATLARHIGEMELPSLAIWDECHHVAAKSWSAIRGQLSGAQHLGLTATPERLDGKGLSEWFSELVVGPSVRDLIDGGYLSDFRYFAPSDPDLASAKMQAGDYRKNDLARMMNTPVLIGDSVAEYKRLVNGKRALVFAVSVEASRALVDRFNADGISAAHVDGTTDSGDRDAATRALASGEIKVLSNVEVFTEGFDLPAIDAVILLRPTKSLALFLQMVGRGLRLADGKDSATIIDHAGLWLDHGMLDAPMEWTLEGGARKRRISASGDGRMRRCPECKEVRVERKSVCECGYEFPTGREVGEYDGQLYELRSSVPEGWATASKFAQENGVTVAAVMSWLRRGLPRYGGLIRVDEGNRWISKNVDLDKTHRRQLQLRDAPLGAEKQKDFAIRHGVSASAVNRWVKSGLPVNDVGFVISDDADRWMEVNIDLDTSRVRSARAVGRDGFMNLKAFARRHGHPSAGQSWVRCGLPITEHGVPVEAGDAWLENHIASNQRSASRISVADDGSVNRTEFARMARASLTSVALWINRGLPTTKNGRIMPDVATEWASRNIKEAQVYPFWLENADEFENRKDFARRVLVSQNTVTRWAKRGLPCSSNGLVHIIPALKWVEDNHHHNRKFTIPHDACQEDNNNQATQPTAA